MIKNCMQQTNLRYWKQNINLLKGIIQKEMFRFKTIRNYNKNKLIKAEINII